MQVGERIPVFKFVWPDDDIVSNDIIKTGWQSVGEVNKSVHSRIMGIDGKMHTCWDDEIELIGTLIIKSIK